MILQIYENPNLPTVRRRLTLELVIGHGLHCGAKFMAGRIVEITARSPHDFAICPGVDCEVDKHNAFGVEEEEDLVQPVNDLSTVIGTRRAERALFPDFDSLRIDDNGCCPTRRLDQRFLTGAASRENPRVRRVLQNLKHQSILEFFLDIELDIPVEIVPPAVRWGFQAERYVKCRQPVRL